MRKGEKIKKKNIKMAVTDFSTTSAFPSAERIFRKRRGIWFSDE